MNGNSLQTMVFAIFVAALVTSCLAYVIKHWQEILTAMAFLFFFSIVLGAVVLWNLLHPS